MQSRGDQWRSMDGSMGRLDRPADGKTSPLTIRDSEEVGSSSFRTVADHRRPMYLTFTWIKSESQVER